MDGEKIISGIAAIVRKKFENESSGHDWYHMERVWKMAKKIALKEKGANLFLVEIIALLHDLEDWKTVNKASSKKLLQTKEILKHFGLQSVLINRVLNNIRNLSYRGKGKSVPRDLEGKIVQDADRLDALGAIGIARVFAFGGNFNRQIYNPEIKPLRKAAHPADVKGTSINHFYEKILKLKDKMNTKTAQTLAKKRHEFVEKFLKEFYKEWNVVNSSKR